MSQMNVDSSTFADLGCNDFMCSSPAEKVMKADLEYSTNIVN